MKINFSKNGSVRTGTWEVFRLRKMCDLARLR